METTHTNRCQKKLIEVNLPLDAINRESARDASLKHGHPSTLHRYWARRPLAACRAIIFATMVDDPSSRSKDFPTPAEQRAERNRLHGLIRRLIDWNNINDENLMAEARYEIAVSVSRARGETVPSTPDDVLRYLEQNAPSVYDPFCGGGSIALEAQRLGLRARASDLNPLPALITKALIELPPHFHGKRPVNPADPLGMLDGGRKKHVVSSWKGASGLADDIRYYGTWMRERAYRQIGHLYPETALPNGDTATVVAWLWAHTVPCPNPACGIPMPLVRTFQISKKKGNAHWTKPVVNRELKTVSWVVQSHGDGVPQRGTVNKNGAFCIGCGTPVKLTYIRDQGKAGAMHETLIAIIAEDSGRKFYLSPTEEHHQVSLCANPAWRPEGNLPEKARSISVQLYGFTEWHKLFTDRQTTALSTFGDLLFEVRDEINRSSGDAKYADAVCTYLAFAISRTADRGCKAAWWQDVTIRPVFTRQSIQMTWVFAETNPFCYSTQNWLGHVEWIAKVVDNLPTPVNHGKVYQADAATTVHASDYPIIITDPPYYDNIHYADSSDFFYVWLRPLLRDIYPSLFAGMMTPKSEEIVANRYRFENHNSHFEERLGTALQRVRRFCSDGYPVSIMYAYKQQEEEHGGKSSSGWETMLTALVNAGFQIVRTWPLRTDNTTGLKSEINALASSIVLVCRPRSEEAAVIVRSDFLKELKQALKSTLDRLTRDTHIRPVDLAQASIGPGMEVYSRYSKVVRASGEPVTVREALIEINNQIAAYHEEETGELDSESQFCLIWMRQNGYMDGDFGDAQILATAKGVDIGRMNGKLVIADRGRVRLLTGDEFADRYYSENMCVWEACARMVWHLEIGEKRGGIQGCVSVARAIGSGYESAERLARVLYNHYESLGDSQNAVRYNSLVTEWRVISDEIGLNTEQLELSQVAQ